MTSNDYWEKIFKDQYILIEVTDFCNLNCIMCSHENIPGPHSKIQGFMNFETFKKIIDELPAKKVPAGYKLFWLGEPFLNPDFPKMLSYIYEKLKNRSEYIDIHTNGHFLNNENIELLLNIGNKLPRLTISLDAIHPETYKKIRRGGDLNKVIENVKKLLHERERRKLSYPGLILQFIIMEENWNEVKEFQDFWINEVKNAKKINKKGMFSKYFNKSLQDVIWFKRIDVIPDKREWAERIYAKAIKKYNIKRMKDDDIEVIISIDNLWESDEGVKKIERIASENVANKTDESTQKKPLRRPCSAIFKTPCFMWDGTLTICCFDPAMQYAIGNIRNKTFKELWHGEILTRIREQHILGRFEDIITNDGYRKCLNCSGYDTPAISDEEIIEYLDCIGRKDLIEIYKKRMDLC